MLLLLWYLHITRFKPVGRSLVCSPSSQPFGRSHRTHTPPTRPDGPQERKSACARNLDAAYAHEHSVRARSVAVRTIKITILFNDQRSVSHVLRIRSVVVSFQTYARRNNIRYNIILYYFNFSRVRYNFKLIVTKTIIAPILLSVVYFSRHIRF